MQKKELEQALADIAENRQHMQKQLCDFAPTDLLLFFSDKSELAALQKRKWLPLINWAKDFLHIDLHTTQSLNVPDNSDFINSLSKVFADLNDRDFCCWYAASLNMRSVLLGLALVKKVIDAQTASELSAVEELWQNKRWGHDKIADQARQLKTDELKEIESFL